MSERNTILKQLQTDITEKIKTTRGYNTDPATILRGIHLLDDITMKPGITFWAHGDKVEENTAGRGQVRVIEATIFLYSDTDGLGDVSGIHNFVDDIESFLYSETDWTYESSTYVDDIVIYEGGASDPNSIATIDIRIFYQK